MAHLPKYRLHKASGRAVWEHGGKRSYLPGPFNSPESRAEYGRRIAELTATTDDAAAARRKAKRAMVCDLIEAYLIHLEGKQHGGEKYCTKDALSLLIQHHGPLPAADFGPLLLAELREKMIAERGWSRKYINGQVNRIRRMYRWGVSREIVDASVWANLKLLEGLKKGRTNARETAKVKPVEWPVVQATLAFATPTLAAMIELQFLTGMRSDEMTGLLAEEIDHTGDVWTYRPADHKTAHRDQVRVICFGPRAQKIIAPRLARGGYLFRPADSETERKAKAAATRKHKVYGRRKAAGPRLPKMGPRYTTSSYQHAILHMLRAQAKAIVEKPASRKLRAWLDEAGLPYWNPHRLRHTRGTLTRAAYGVEGSQCQLGHASLEATELYAEQSLHLAKRIARETG